MWGFYYYPLVLNSLATALGLLLPFEVKLLEVAMGLLVPFEVELLSHPAIKAALLHLIAL